MTDDQIRKDVEFLSAASRQELLFRWEQLNGSSAPEGLSTSLLRRGVIYDVQAKHYGGLSPAHRKTLLQIAASKTAVPPASMKAGARLVREWNGIAHVVDIVENGFRYRDKTYASLSAISKEITGAHWSGPRFFGIKGKAR
ncbi:MAG: DUF2924 domain-containing protein [Hyphomonadaceae bacterium]|nr:DUF2924 domain-containing protein [Hyphomonadaceae bacterium]